MAKKIDQVNMAAHSDHEDDRQFKLILSTLIWVSWSGTFFGIILSLYYLDGKLFAVTLAGCALLGVPFVLLKSRHLYASGMVLMLIMLGMTTFIATVGQGIRDLAVFGFLIVIIFAGLALNRTYFRFIVGLSLVAVCWLVIGESFGLFITTPFTGGVTNWFYLVGITIIFLIAALAVDLLSTNIRKSLERERAELARRERVEEEIRQLNTELEQRVEDRSRELHEAQKQLVHQEKLAMLGQLAGSMGHELRNPLGVISNAAYYLKLTQPDAGEQVQEYLRIIENETRSAEKIITDLLDFSRNVSADRALLAISELVGRTLERFPASPSVQVRLELPPDLPQVFADPLQMEQVLGNLVVNACQAMAEGGRLTISAKRQKELVRIIVQDTGTGIRPENLPKIFEPLYTTKLKGIGLGLHISKRLVEANGGRLEVESEAGKGTTFTLVLPVKE